MNDSPACTTPPKTTRRVVPLDGRKWIEGKLDDQMVARVPPHKKANHKDNGSHVVDSTTNKNKNKNAATFDDDDDDDNENSSMGPSDFDENPNDVVGWSFSR